MAHLGDEGVVSGGWAGGAVLRDLDEAPRPDAPGDRARAQPRRRHLRLGRGAVGRRPRQHGAQRPRQHGRDPQSLCILGRHRRHPRRGSHRVRGPWLRRHRADADAADPAGPCSPTGRRPAVRDGVRHRRRPPQQVRPRRRLRWHQLGRAHRVPARVPPGRRPAVVQVHLARHAPEVRRCVHLHLRAERARLDVDPRLPVRCRHGDGDRRVHATDVGRVGLRADVEGSDDRHLRARLRPAPRRQRTDLERHPPARLGGVDELPAGDLRAVVPPERRADGRRRCHRALLDRLRNPSRVRQCDCARRTAAQRADDGSRVPALPGRATGRSAAPAVGGTQQPRMVRGGRALPRPAPGAVRLLAAHPVAADLAREPAAARPRVAALGRGLVPGAGRRNSGPGADVRPVPAARTAADQPRRRLADGAVPGDRRLPDRLALRALRRARQGRRRAGVHRDDLRVAGGPDHPGVHRLVLPRSRDRLDPPHRVRAPRDRDQDLLPDRSLGGARARPSSAGTRSTRHCTTATGR